MFAVTALAFALDLGFLTQVALFLFRNQTGLIIVCSFAWMAHLIESIIGSVLLFNIRVPLRFVWKWTLLIFLFGFLSLGPLKKRIQKFKQDRLL
jgi:hypothetical protein